MAVGAPGGHAVRRGCFGRDGTCWTELGVALRTGFGMLLRVAAPGVRRGRVQQAVRIGGYGIICCRSCVSNDRGGSCGGCIDASATRVPSVPRVRRDRSSPGDGCCAGGVRWLWHL